MPDEVVDIAVGVVVAGVFGALLASSGYLLYRLIVWRWFG